MTDFDKILVELKEYFKLRGYQDSTIDLYSNWLLGLFKFYPTTVPKDISEFQIHSYITILVNRKYSFSSVNQFFQTKLLIPDSYYQIQHSSSFEANENYLNRDKFFSDLISNK